LIFNACHVAAQVHFGGQSSLTKAGGGILLYAGAGGGGFVTHCPKFFAIGAFDDHKEPAFLCVVILFFWALPSR
jgi:hypothetical protein